MKFSYQLQGHVHTLRHLCIKACRPERRPIQEILPGFMPAPKAWYRVLILKTLETFFLLSIGLAIAIFLLAIKYYSGHDS
jgi:hypothetical protein